MPILKYKDEQGNWNELNHPVKLVEGSEIFADVEHVTISTGYNSTAFPDLSPYISDISQIAMMCWRDVVRSGATASIYTYIYNPHLSANLVSMNTWITASSKDATIGQDLRQTVTTYSYKVGGTPDAITFSTLTSTHNLNFVGQLDLYYYKEA